MKKFNKFLVIALALSFVFSFVTPATAATTPTLGVATSFGILSSTYTNTATGTTISGDVGYTTGPAVTPTISGTTHVADATYSQAATAQGTALVALNAQTCDGLLTFGTATDLSLLPQPLTPGVYCITGAMSVGTGGITLNGAGTYIFRSTGALTTVANSVVSVTGGASECDVFWTPGAATTLGADSTFLGTDIDASGITIGHNVTWSGRALAYGGTISTNADTITVPTCGSLPVTTASINVVKVVINNNGGTKAVSSFPLFVDGVSVASGTTNIYSAPATYTVTETSDSQYTQTFSASCPAGVISVVGGDVKLCTVTNDDKLSGGGSGEVINFNVVPPLLDVVKVPSPLALPNGPGSVKYTYTLRNPGTVPVTNITMVGDSCSPIALISGDTNNDSKLDVTETWTYTCSTTLSSTHTNTVTATGWANGVSTSDIASATVVVGVPSVPPLIHVTKVPNPLSLVSGGGMVTYTEKVTNPGTVALSNVILKDDKCAPMQYISGDVNGDSKLDINETWTYTCSGNLSKTTTNTAIVSGNANGLTATDFAIATVIVAAPTLPNTGFYFEDKMMIWSVVALLIIAILSLTSIIAVLRKRKI